MAIIVEGFDNSGKSTLAKHFGLSIEHPGPKPRNVREENQCLETQSRMARLPIIMDRVTCVSSQIYANRLFEPKLMEALKDMLNTPHCILVYCRPSLERITDFSGHIQKAYDKASDVNWLQKNAVRLVAQYDQLMKQVPHIVFDWENPNWSQMQEVFDAQFTLGAWRQCQKSMQ